AEMRLLPNIAMFDEMRRMDVRQVIYQFLNLAMVDSCPLAVREQSKEDSFEKGQLFLAVLPSLVVNSSPSVHWDESHLSYSRLPTGCCGLTNE
ncbi:hypothetical protein PMAYCL1PPCAC_24824, partial [Pristionchus mayeri]